MKKEIMNLLDLGTSNKVLKVNEIFELVASYLDKNGTNVELSKKEPEKVVLNLVYTGFTAKYYCHSTVIKSRDYADIVNEVHAEMEKTLDEIKETLTKNFINGYLG